MMHGTVEDIEMSDTSSLHHGGQQQQHQQQQMHTGASRQRSDQDAIFLRRCRAIQLKRLFLSALLTASLLLRHVTSTTCSRL